jgi:translation initiation factor 2D
VLQIHNPLPPPLFTGAPLFVPAVKNLSTPNMIPDVPEDGLVALVTSEANDEQVQYVGVGRIAAKGGVRAAVERRMKNLRDRNDVDEGKFCDILCIMNDQ